MDTLIQITVIPELFGLFIHLDPTQLTLSWQCKWTCWKEIFYMQIMFSDQEAPPVILQKRLEHPWHLGDHHLCGVCGIQRLPDSGSGGQAAGPSAGSKQICRLWSLELLGDAFLQCHRYRNLPGVDQGMNFEIFLENSAALSLLPLRAVLVECWADCATAIQPSVVFGKIFYVNCTSFQCHQQL